MDDATLAIFERYADNGHAGAAILVAQERARRGLETDPAVLARMAEQDERIAKLEGEIDRLRAASGPTEITLTRAEDKPGP